MRLVTSVKGGCSRGAVRAPQIRRGERRSAQLRALGADPCGVCVCVRGSEIKCNPSHPVFLISLSLSLSQSLVLLPLYTLTTALSRWGQTFRPRVFFLCQSTAACFFSLRSFRPPPALLPQTGSRSLAVYVRVRER